MKNILKQVYDKRLAESQRRAKVLLNIAQRYYLEIWLMLQEKYNVLALPSDLYRRDFIECPWAKERARKQLSAILKNGHLNRNYNRLIDSLSKSNLSITGFVYNLARKRAA